MFHRPSLALSLLVACLATVGQSASSALPETASAVNPFAKSPPLLGWSSWSSTWSALGQKMNEDYIKAQADVMAEKLKSSGFAYINLDDGWSGAFDEHGRLQPDSRKFPGGISALAAYVHGKGLKLGIYLTPGLRIGAWQANGTVAGGGRPGSRHRGGCCYL